jgi:hypothetical protein
MTDPKEPSDGVETTPDADRAASEGFSETAPSGQGGKPRGPHDVKPSHEALGAAHVAAGTVPPEKPACHANGHVGSASSNLSGRAVLAAWFISIGAHTLAFVGMLLLVFPFTPQGKARELPATTIVGPLDGTSAVPTPLTEPTRPVEVPLVQEQRPVPKKFADLSELTTVKKPELPIIGIGVGGDFDSFRLPMDMGDGAEFFGLGGSARGTRKIVYVVDRSGSMIDSFVFVQAELKRSVSALRRSQKFHVIFFNSGPPLENPPGRLVSAIEAHKQQLFEFTDSVIPRGDTKPERALERALSMEPDLVYLLSDGIDFRPSLLEALDAWNKNRRARIFTIAYLDQTGRELLERIAREHNGEFKFVSEDDLP